MKKFLVVLVCLLGLAYVLRERIAHVVFSIPAVQDMPCEVKGMTCRKLALKLNDIRPGRYFEDAGKLLEVADSTDMYRDGGGVVFKLQDGTTLIHNQGMASREKGYLTVILPNKIGLKFDDKGDFVSRL